VITKLLVLEELKYSQVHIRVKLVSTNDAQG